MTEQSKHPRDARGAVEAYLERIVDDHDVIGHDAELADAVGEMRCAGEHLGVGGGVVTDDVHVEEAVIVSYTLALEP